MQLDALFSDAQLSICAHHASASDAASVSETSREAVFFDETLAFSLLVRLANSAAQVSEQQAHTFLSSPALQIQAELGYIDSSAPNQQPADTLSSSSHAETGVPFTPLPQPSTSSTFPWQKAEIYATAPIQSAWSIETQNIAESLRVVREGQDWVGLWRMTSKICMSITIQLLCGISNSDDVQPIQQ